jgi:hypothetical protein
MGDSQPLYASNGALAAEVYWARWQGDLPVIEPLDVSFANGLDLVGYQKSDLGAGEPFTVTLYWQPRRELKADVQMVVQLLDRDGGKVAAVHDWPLREAYRVQAWRPHETMPLSYRFDIPTDLSPGPYRLMAGPYDLMHQARIPLLDGQEIATVATVKIALPPSNERPDRSVEASFGRAIALTGYTLSPTSSGLDVTLFWRAQALVPEDYTVFVHLVDHDGRLVAQADAQPLGGRYPTSIWSIDERVIDPHQVPAPPGEYRVYVGLYLWQTLERLPVSINGRPLPDGQLKLDVVQVR